jgi:hypothetical protein
MAVAACFTRDWAQFWFQITQFAYCFGPDINFHSLYLLFHCLLASFVLEIGKGILNASTILQKLNHMPRLVHKLFKCVVSAGEISYYLIRRPDIITIS